MALTSVAIGAEPGATRFSLRWGGTYNLSVFNLGLACCAVEVVAASVRSQDFDRLGVTPFATSSQQAEVMVVSGTVTDKMAPVVKRLYDEMPEPKFVISFGSCSNSGGPYWDSYCVTKGVDQLIPIDVYVPGCPPRPEALLDGIAQLHAAIDHDELAVQYAARGSDQASLQAPLVPPPTATA